LTRPNTGLSLVLRIVGGLMLDLVAFVHLSPRSRVHLAAETRIPRKRLALYLERTVRPRRADRRWGMNRS